MTTLGAVPTYADKVLSYDPVAYWIQGEAAGLTAIDQINSPAQDGTYVGVTLGQPGIGDGNTCPLFDGVNDFNNVDTVALDAAYNGAEFTLMVWLRMLNVGVWTDGVRRYAALFRIGVNDLFYIRKAIANNTLIWHRIAGAVAKTVTTAGHADTDWMTLALSCSEAANELRAFKNGIQEGLTQVAIGNWVGGALTRGLIGADAGPANVANGYLAHAALFPLLTPAQIADLAVLP